MGVGSGVGGGWGGRAPPPRGWSLTSFASQVEIAGARWLLGLLATELLSLLPADGQVQAEQPPIQPQPPALREVGGHKWGVRGGTYSWGGGRHNQGVPKGGGERGVTLVAAPEWGVMLGPRVWGWGGGLRGGTEHGGVTGGLGTGWGGQGGKRGREGT